MRNGSINWRAMGCTPRRAYQRREKLLNGREHYFKRNEQLKIYFSFIKSSATVKVSALRLLTTLECINLLIYQSLALLVYLICWVSTLSFPSPLDSAFI